MNLQEVLNQAKQLSPVDKVRLIQQLSFDLENELRDRPSTSQQQHWTPPAQSNWDMSANMEQRPSAPDMDQARWDEWANFPD